jgi:hypothetical protein
VAVVYLDTSALGRVLLGEPDAEAVLRELAPFESGSRAGCSGSSCGG